MTPEYLLIAALTGWDEEGEQVTAVVMVPSDTPTHRLLGLVESARIQLRQHELDDE